MGLSISDQARSKLYFSYGDGALGTYFNTGLTTETLIGLSRLSFTIFHYKYLRWASCHTLLVTNTLIFINYYFKHNVPPAK